MPESSIEPSLVSRLLLDRDAEYRRANAAEQLVEELSDARVLKEKYERLISEKKRDIEEKRRIIEEKNEYILRLEQKLLYLERKMWGAMSEKHRVPDDPNQLRLDFEKTDMSEEEANTVGKALEEIDRYRSTRTAKAREKRIPVRRKLPAELRHVEEHVYPEGYIGHEDEWILFSDTETSEHLELQPAELYVRVTIRHKGIRKADKLIRTAPVQDEPIAKSYASASLLTDLMVGKYVDHLPFYRQIQMFKRLGFSIPAATIEGWFHDVADLMRPAYFRLKELVLASDYVQSDETTVPIINSEKHRTVKGYLWLVRDVMNGLVFFFYNEGTRSAKVVLQLFKDFHGAIQTDGYPGYGILEKLEGIITICCWAHCRRYFDRALYNDKARAEYALAQIGIVYDVEDMADSQEMDHEQRCGLRKRLAYPVIRAFEKWCITEYPKVLPKSPIGKAINYFLTYSRQLARYTIDGRYKPDSNLIENSVRPVALGRKNYLFCGNHDAAEDAAVIYSLMGCCKVAGVDFKKWTLHFLNHIHEYDNDYTKDLAELLPHNLKELKLL